MSPELDLLDQLMGSDESLNLALQIFGWPGDAEALERARHSVTEQVKEGLVEVKQRAAGSERVLPRWEARQILGEEVHWLRRSEEAEYYLSLTVKGSKYMGG